MLISHIERIRRGTENMGIFGEGGLNMKVIMRTYPLLCLIPTHRSATGVVMLNSCFLWRYRVTHTGVWPLLSQTTQCNWKGWNQSPIHTARWSRKIARKLPECLLCERKHVPGLIPGLIPGWGPSNIAGFSPGTSAVWTKPDQCRKGCVVVMTHFIVRLFYRVFWRQINVHTTKNM